MSKGKFLGGAILLAVLFVGSFSVFTISEWERALVFRLGEIVRADDEPGLHFMLPFVNNVRKYDGRIQTLDTPPERFLTSEKKNVIVDSFVKWRISDVALFYKTVRGDVVVANMRLDQTIKDGLRSEFSKRTIKETVSGERSEIMRILLENANAQAADLGIEIIDVRVKRVDLPPEVSSSVYRRMQAERERIARDFRSRGAEAAERIRADADRRRTVIQAEAYRDAEQTRGEGDARASEIFALAYSRDEEFFALYRSLDAYTNVFRGRQDVLILEPDSDFFRYFRQRDGS